MSAHSREEARRIVGVSERQLRSWERQKLISPVSVYGFRELLALRTLVKLRGKVSPLQLRRALAALRQTLGDIENPLTDLKLYAHGKKIRVEVDGHAMDAESGQLLLNFDQMELSRLLEFPVKDGGAAAARDQRLAAERWFQRGLELEQSGAPVGEIIAAYGNAIELDPKSAGALVNLGTIHFNVRNWNEAERCYHQALEVDPNYALAHFDLGNLYDDRGDRVKALAHYEAALRIAPNYSDAHYNLALIFQAMNQPMKAVQHWKAYLKLDPSSHWSTIARRELAKLREATVLPGSRR